MSVLDLLSFQSAVLFGSDRPFVTTTAIILIGVAAVLSALAAWGTRGLALRTGFVLVQDGEVVDVSMEVPTAFFP